jgi:hypothetical protein
MQEGVGWHATGEFLEFGEGDVDWLIDPCLFRSDCDTDEGFRVGSQELDSFFSRFHSHATESFNG